MASRSLRLLSDVPATGAFGDNFRVFLKINAPLLTFGSAMLGGLGYFVVSEVKSAVRLEVDRSSDQIKSSLSILQTTISTLQSSIVRLDDQMKRLEHKLDRDLDDFKGKMKETNDRVAALEKRVDYAVGAAVTSHLELHSFLQLNGGKITSQAVEDYAPTLLLEWKKQGKI